MDHTRSGSGRLTLRELRKSDFVEALELLDKEDDINKVGCSPGMKAVVVTPTLGDIQKIDVCHSMRTRGTLKCDRFSSM